MELDHGDLRLVKHDVVIESPAGFSRSRDPDTLEPTTRYESRQSSVEMVIGDTDVGRTLLSGASRPFVNSFFTGQSMYLSPPSGELASEGYPTAYYGAVGDFAPDVPSRKASVGKPDSERQRFPSVSNCAVREVRSCSICCHRFLSPTTMMRMKSPWSIQANSRAYVNPLISF